MDLGVGDQIDYDLRQNSKKSYRLSSGLKHHCNICGKGFHTMRQLCGHLKHHSPKGKESKERNVCKECGKEFGSLKGLHGHMRCHKGGSREIYGGLAWKKKSRSRRSKVKVSSNSWVTNLSDYVTELDSELEEVAMILIMMSKGDRNESIMDDDNKKTEILTSDGLLVHNELKLDDEYRAMQSDMEMEKQCGEVKMEEADMENDLMNGSGEAKVNDYDPELGESSCRKLNCALDPEVFNGSDKKGKFGCKSCGMVFNSHQALGGHRVSKHRVSRSSIILKTETCANGIEADITPDVEANGEEFVKVESGGDSIDLGVEGVTVTRYLVKNAKYECAVCFKVFASGQALGGHKRAHFVRNTEIKENHSDSLTPIDLNLPGKVEEDGCNHIGLKSCWLRDNQKYEPLVGLVSN